MPRESTSSYSFRDARVVFNLLKELTSEKFPNTLKSSVGGFFFLRLVCPAIVTPEIAEIRMFTSSSTEQCTAAALVTNRRALILISKCIQNLANGVAFSEACMKSLNSWLDDNKEKMNDFLLSLAVCHPIIGTKSCQELSPEEKPPSLFPKVPITLELGEAISSFFLPQWDGIASDLKEQASFTSLPDLTDLVNAIQVKQKKHEKAQEKEKGK